VYPGSTISYREPGCSDPRCRSALVTLRVVPVEEAQGQRVGQGDVLRSRAAASVIRAFPLARAWRNRA
jgi:hypothetical protein